MNKKYIIILSVLCFYLGAKAQDIAPLKIGDKIPDEVWNTEFSAISGNGKINKITLSQFKGKAIIIDFWATWCTSCIKEMPKLKALQNKFQENLMVLSHTSESEEKVLNFLKGNKIGKENLQLSIINDVSLKKLFPHRFLPHYIWINPQGIVDATSTSDDITEQNIKKIIKGEEASITNKEDLDPSLPLFMKSGIKGLNMIQYSILTKGLYNGLGSGNQYRKENGILKGRAMTNASLKTIYEIIARKLFSQQNLRFTKNQFVIQVKDAKALSVMYNYELTVHISKANLLYQFMLEDLNKSLPYDAGIEIRSDSSVFVIRDKVK